MKRRSSPRVERWRLPAALALASLILPAEPLPPEILLLARIQAKAKLGLSAVPAYACAETISRSERLPTRIFFSKVDELKLEVAEIGGRELYAEAGATQFQDKPLDEMIGRGLISTGMFYHVAHGIFAGPASRFTFVERKRYKGRMALKYDFQISPLFAQYTLHMGGHAGQCGMRGSVWADELSLDLIRIHLEATEIPPELRVRNAATDIEYNRASLGGKSFLIPSSSDVVIVLADGVADRNRIQFSNCRNYGVESTLSFQ